MKVTLINTTDAGGGAPVACMRLLKALEQKQVDVNLVVQEKQTAEPRVKAISAGLLGRLKTGFDFFYERIPFIVFKAKEKSLRFAFSTANAGTDISDHPDVLNADILHLHWTNAGYLSIGDLKELFRLEKPVVWTLHDMWAFTGGCHYSGGTDHFVNQCGDCWMLRNPGSNDISHIGWLRKAEMYRGVRNIVFVTCSHWLAGEARRSSLLKGFRIDTIPNPIDTDLFSPKDKPALKAKWLIEPGTRVILFGAANILDRRKGISYLIDALNCLKTDYADMSDIEIVIFGKNKSLDVSLLPFKGHEMHIVTSQKQMADLYAMADVFVTPAIEDNLPNTVMESLACGTPVVAFNTGGIPDMVDHLQNGYLAEFKSAADLANGLNYILTSDNKQALSANARDKVLQNFTNEIIASKYIELYKTVLNQ